MKTANALPNGPPADMVRDTLLITKDVQMYEEVSKNTRPATVPEEYDLLISRRIVSMTVIANLNSPASISCNC
jgi:hypothetical protein